MMHKEILASRRIRSLRQAGAAALLAILLAPALAQDAGAQVRVASEHGFWKIICETPPGAKSEQCGMHQSVQDEKRPELGLSITMLRPADRKGDLLRIQAPLGVLLPTGVGLEIDEQKIGTAFFVRCFQDGCWADVEIDEKLLETLRKGKVAIFKVFPSPEEGIGIPVDLTGFSEAYANLK
ncbi:MAG: invasion associated locus B family protein [Rhizobiaceae bacterium]